MGSVSKRPSTLQILLGFAVLVLTRPFYRFQKNPPATAIKRDSYMLLFYGLLSGNCVQVVKV